MTLELAYRPMHYCSICIQPPDLCACAWARDPETVMPAPELVPPPEPDPSPDTQATLPIEWPERSDIA